ncbi:hypothetical protein GR183_20130 [Stappia sp. GBMRC 2046]|uniref:Polysaccharide chain length determinant N-terminal domain-containing protein n=1 Tax=Stappia sediminis TaxID=2692190 RepID=A0A7X3LY36_9HYPH|nr:Wzz/FepE/Etk N-terminal domain-containing protein [Stappia sediminis]MXN67222.1 hypothetical protein [Stappia sediminis]
MHDSFGRSHNLQHLQPSSDETLRQEQNLLAWAAEVLKRQLIVAIAVFLCVVVLSVLLVAMLERFYTATALVVVDPTESRLLGMMERGRQDDAALGVIETEVEIARSADVLDAVIERLELAEDDEYRYRPSSVNRVLGWIGLSPVADPLMVGEGARLRREAERAAVVQNLARTLNVRRRGITSIISVSAESRSPEKAAMIANAVAEEYIAFQARSKAMSAERAVRLLDGRVEAMSANIRNVEDRLDLFIASAAERYGTPEVATRVRELKTLLKDETERAGNLRADAASLARLRSQDGELEDIAELVGGGTLNRTLAERRAAQTFLQQAGPDETERANAVRERLAEIDRTLETTIGEYKQNLSQARQEAKDRIGELRAELQSSLGDISIPNEGMVEFYTLQREAESGRQLYDETLTRLRQLELQSNFAIADARIVSRAMLPEEISFPAVKIMLGLGFAAALATAWGAAVLREQYIGGYRSVDQIEALTGQTVLSSIPYYRPLSGDLANALVEEPLSPYAEALRRAKLNIDVMLDFPEKLSLIMTSTTRGEGKSTVALGLAETYALAGRRTVLVDADLRQPSIASMVGEAQGAGLFDWLTRTDVPLQSVIYPDQRPRHGELSFIFGGSRDELPTDRLVASERFGELLKALSDAFEVIIIDTPPFGQVVDAGIMARNVDLSLYIVQWGATSQIEAWTGLRELERARASRLSVIVNQSKEKSTSYAYGYGYHSDTKA